MTVRVGRTKEVLGLSLIGAALSLGLALTMGIAAGATAAVALSVPILLAAPIRFRVAILWIGMYVVLFESSDVLFAAKGALLVWSLFLAYKGSRRPLGRKLIWPTAIGLGIVAGSAITAVFQPTTPLQWVRDASIYVIGIIAPLIGVGVFRDWRQREVEVALAIAALLVSLGTFFTWSGQRGTFSLSVSQPVLTSFVFGAFALVYFLARRHPRAESLAQLELGAAVGAVALLAATGTRTVVLALPALILAVTLGKQRVRKVLAIGTVSLAFVMALAATVPGAIEFSSDRFSSLLNSDLADSDLSLRVRAESTDVAIAAVRESPLWGVGPGYQYEVRYYNDKRKSSAQLDSPLAGVADLGLGGVILLLIVLLQIRIAVGADSALFVGSTALILCWSLALTIHDDKGLALVLLFASGVGRLRGSGTRQSWSQGSPGSLLGSGV